MNVNRTFKIISPILSNNLVTKFLAQNTSFSRARYSTKIQAPLKRLFFLQPSFSPLLEYRDRQNAHACTSMIQRSNCSIWEHSLQYCGWGLGSNLESPRFFPHSKPDYFLQYSNTKLLQIVNSLLNACSHTKSPYITACLQ